MGCPCLRRLEITKRLLPFQHEIVKVAALEELKNVKFQITTEKITQIKAQVIVIFMDQTIQVNKNDAFGQLGIPARRLQEYAAAYMQSKGLKITQSQQYISFDIKVPSLKCKKASILFCKAWTSKNKNDDCLKQILRKYLESIQIYGCKTIVLTEFPSFLGVHLQKGVRRLMHQLVRMTKKPQKIICCCLTSASKKVFTNYLKYNYQELNKSFEQIEEDEESEYY